MKANRPVGKKPTDSEPERTRVSLLLSFSRSISRLRYLLCGSEIGGCSLATGRISVRDELEESVKAQCPASMAVEIAIVLKMENLVSTERNA